MYKRQELAHANADGAKFNGAVLTKITVTEGSMSGADFTGADLTEAEFIGVWFTPVTPDGRAANPEAAEELSGAKFSGVSGLTPDQIKQCKSKGATFDSQSAQSTVT